MNTKPNLQKDNIKEQEVFVPEGYTRPGVNARSGADARADARLEDYTRPNALASQAAQASSDTQTNLDTQASSDIQIHPDAHATPGADAGSNAATVVKSEKGGSTIVDFNYEKYADVERKATHTNAVAGLTLGILSLVTMWFSSLLSLVLSIVGIVFSLTGRSEPGGKSMATGGLVCSIIGLALSLLFIIWTMVFVVSFIDGVSSIWQ